LNSVDLAVVEYGVGNLGSVAHACRRAGIEPRIVRDGKEIAARPPSHVILPGVGAVGEALTHLRGRGFEEPLRRLAFDARVPFLAICVGMQMLAERCHEFGAHQGLGWLPGAETGRLAEPGSGIRLPHVGWNTVECEGEGLFAGLDDRHFYFVHSYVLECDSTLVAGRTTYAGLTFASAVRRDNLVGVQFHPEKSSAAGATVIRNFVGLEGRTQNC
jgi:glutamine amidotransferase